VVAAYAEDKEEKVNAAVSLKDISFFSYCWFSSVHAFCACKAVQEKPFCIIMWGMNSGCCSFSREWVKRDKIISE
jgi:hypothetical protein